MNTNTARLLEDESKHDDPRTDYQRDSCKILHSFAFRRLQGKMQIYGNYNSDFHRTRLTHSLEVASIASNITAYLKQSEASVYELSPEDRIPLNAVLYSRDSPNYLDQDLIHSLGLLHDIGHPPFGHGGEVALNCILNRYSANQIGFEGNAQSLRVAKQLNLTRRTMLGLLKYPAPYSKLKRLSIPILESSEAFSPNQMITIQEHAPPKCYFDCDQSLINWIFEPFVSDKARFQMQTDPDETNHAETYYKSIDSSIMDLADDIAYSLHDLEDALFLKLLSLEELQDFRFNGLNLNEHYAKVAWLSPHLLEVNHFINALFSAKPKKLFSHLTHELITSTQFKVTHPDFKSPLLRYNVTLPKSHTEFLNAIKHLIRTKVIFSQENQSIVFGGQILVMRLFQAIHANPEILLSEKDRAAHKQEKSEARKLRIIADYIAGMTDQYAQQLYQRLYGLNLRSIFEKL